MKIVDVTAATVHHQFGKPKDGPYNQAHFYTLRMIIRVFTDDGLVGLGSSFGGPAAEFYVRKMLKPQLLGKDPLHIEPLVNSLMDVDVPREAISGVETALWDIKGKALGVPVYQLLGGAYRDKIKVYAAKIIAPEPEEAAREALELAARGFVAAKIQFCLDLEKNSPRQDLERAAAVRQAVPDMELIADVNGRYTLPVAVQVARQLEELDCVLEEPLGWRHLDPTLVRCYAQLRRSATTPIAGGEQLRDRRELKEVLIGEAIDVVQHRVTITGISEAKKMCEMAESFDVPWSPGCYNLAIDVVATLHVAAAVPNYTMLEYWKNPGTEELRENLLKSPQLRLKDGYLELPQKPGLGIELDEEKAQEYTIRDWDIHPEDFLEGEGKRIYKWHRWYSMREHW